MILLLIAYLLTLFALIGLVLIFEKQPTKLNKVFIQYSMVQLWVLQTTLIVFAILSISNPVLLYIVSVVGGILTANDIVKVYNALVKDSLSELHKH